MKKLLYILCAVVLAAGCSADATASYNLAELVIDTANCLAEGSYVQGVEANDLCRIKIPYEIAMGGTARISAPETNGLRIDAQEVAHICEVVLAAEGVEREVEISLSYVDEDEMHELNHEWRGIDRTTDVLSCECDSAFDEDIPADETLELGDVILAPQVIARQAPGFGNSPADECRLMLVHGMLHLLGFDHNEDDEAEVMEAREDAILRDLALERGEDPKLVHVGPITNHAHD